MMTAKISPAMCSEAIKMNCEKQNVRSLQNVLIRNVRVTARLGDFD